MLPNPQPKAISTTERPVPVAAATASQQSMARHVPRETYPGRLEQPVQLAQGYAAGGGSAGRREIRIGQIEIDVPPDRGELRRLKRFAPLLLALVRGAAGQRHQTREVAHYGFAEFVGQERDLRVRCVEGRG